MSKVQKNYSIEAYRFILSIIIMLFHFRKMFGDNQDIIGGGYLVVEFFFIVSGFLVMKSFVKHENQTTQLSIGDNVFNEMKRKFLRLFPHYAFSFIVAAIIIVFIFHRFTVNQVVSRGVYEFLMINMAGIGDVIVNAADWYVSALFIASFVIYVLLYKFGSRNYAFVIGPLIAIVVYSLLYKQVGDLGCIRDSFMFLTYAAWRGIAGMSVGCICYAIYEKVGTTNKPSYKIINTIGEIVLLILISKVLFQVGKTYTDFFIVILEAILIVSVFAGNSYLSAILNNRLSAYLGKISYAMYLNHTIFRDVFKLYFANPENIVLTTVIYVVIVIVYSMFTTWFVDKVFNLIVNGINSKKSEVVS